MESIKCVLRISEEIAYVLTTQSFPGKVKLKSDFKSCYLCIVRNKDFSYEQALFVVRAKSMFRKPKILILFPLTLELHIEKKENVFTISWGDIENPMCEFIVSNEAINIVTAILNDYPRYQQEPFHLECSHHKWVWFYQETIPVALHSPCSTANRPRSLLIDHYGKRAMEAYVSTQIQGKQEEFTTSHNFTVTILTWNAGGYFPGSSKLREWFLCQNKKYTDPIDAPDIIVIGLQEMCELTKLRGDLIREQEWVKYFISEMLEIFSPDTYENICQGSLVGILSTIFVKRVISPLIKEVSTFQVKLGLKGFAGNKGALAYRFRILSSSFCFINVHLAPHKQNFKLRNENINTISKAVKFTLPCGDSYSIFEHDHVFWFGDLNYRLNNISTRNIIKYITNNDIQFCLENDQLRTAMKTLNILRDFREGEIDFLPTFKYLIGSNQHNLRREPSWCDRVLWKGPAILNRYSSCDSIQVSDHKPVFSHFSLRVLKLDSSKLSELKSKIYKELEDMHHKFMPKISISKEKIIFEEIRYRFVYKDTFEIVNIGTSRLILELISDKWVSCSPVTCDLSQQETVEISVQVSIDIDFLRKHRTKCASLTNAIRIIVKNGIEYKVGLQTNVIDSFIGYSCEEICKMWPSTTYPDLPKPLIRIAEYIKNFDGNTRDLFEIKLDFLAIAHTIKLIDCDIEFDENVSGLSVIHVLLEFLRTLKKPILDGDIVDTKINMMHIIGFALVKHQVFDLMNQENVKCLMFVVDMLKGLIGASNGVTAGYLANKMYKIIFQVKEIPYDKKKNRVLFLELLFST